MFTHHPQHMLCTSLWMNGKEKGSTSLSSLPGDLAGAGGTGNTPLRAGSSLPRPAFGLLILVKVGLLELVSTGDKLVVPAAATVWSLVPRMVPASFIPPHNNSMTPSHQVINFYLKPHKKNKISEFPCTILTINKKPAGYTLGYI